MDKNLMIRNSTTEFLIFQSQSKEDPIEVKYADEMIWLSQKMMAKLFEVDVRTINEHLKNIFKSNELFENSTVRNFRIVQSEGNRQVERNIEFYNLDAIISVGYRVNSKRATQFRIWATNVLKEYIIKDDVLVEPNLNLSNNILTNIFLK